MTVATSVPFSGRTWMVKTSEEPVGPGHNRFAEANVVVDRHGLHLHIAPATVGWTCAEVVGQGEFGYGRYAWTLASDVSRLDPVAVLGLFTWSGEAAHANREIDIELTAAWGPRDGPVTGTFTVHSAHPPSAPAFALPRASRSEHTLDWAPGRITLSTTTAGARPVEHTFSGRDLPTPGGGVAPRMNLWLAEGHAPQNPQEVVVERFDYRRA